MTRTIANQLNRHCTFPAIAIRVEFLLKGLKLNSGKQMFIIGLKKNKKRIIKQKKEENKNKKSISI